MVLCRFGIGQAGAQGCEPGKTGGRYTQAAVHEKLPVALGAEEGGDDAGLHAEIACLRCVQYRE